MRDLLDTIISSITGSKDYEIESTEGEVLELKVIADPSIMGLIIGKGGKTVSAIRNLLKVRAVIENTRFNLGVEEKGQS